MMFAPLEGWRHVKVTDRHTAVDYAGVLKDSADIHFAHAKTIVLVQDNLSIHSKASLYEAFPALEARRLVERFEWHYTPKHGSWLNLAESELGVLTSQGLDRRIPNKQILIEEIAAWEHDRNANHPKADWQFTTKNARIKLKHLYPAIWLNQATSKRGCNHRCLALFGPHVAAHPPGRVHRAVSPLTRIPLPGHLCSGRVPGVSLQKASPAPPDHRRSPRA